MCFLITIQWFFCLLINHFRKPKTKHQYHVYKKPTSNQRPTRYQRKPDWVVNEVIRLKAHLPNASGYTIAHTFNQIHSNKNITISKSYAYQQFIKQAHQILQKQRNIKQHKPTSYRNNHLWQLDLTKVNDKQIFGVIDCGSRACLALKPIKDKRTITLLKSLLDVIELYGKPKAIRTDNEAVFTSKLFRLFAKLLVIEKQTTQIASPWQNGRIERFFGTLKRYTKQAIINGGNEQRALTEFRFWYNHVRPHQALNGATPDQIWSGRQPKHSGQYRYISFWDGMLDGFYKPPD